MAYYGHGSWLIVAGVLVMVVMRGLGGRRGRAGRTRSPAGRPTPAPWAGFVSGGGPGPGGPTPTSDSGIPPHTGIPAGWLPDPSGRYDQRYWSGAQWTDHVTRDGAPATDPFPQGRIGPAEPVDGADPPDPADPGGNGPLGEPG